MELRQPWLLTLENLAVNPNRCVNGAWPGEVLFHSLARGDTNSRSLFSVREHLLKPICQRINVSWWHEPTRTSIFDSPEQATNRRGNHRQAARHRLERHDPLRFGAGGQRK